MKMFISRGGKDHSGCLLLDYPPENLPPAICYNGKAYALRTGLSGGAAVYGPSDALIPDESVEVIENDGSIGCSVLRARVEKIDNDDYDDCDD